MSRIVAVQPLFPQADFIPALTRYRDELTCMEFTREISSLVDCCNVILMANQGGKL
jgi:hypothetical protein